MRSLFLTSGCHGEVLRRRLLHLKPRNPCRVSGDSTEFECFAYWRWSLWVFVCPEKMLALILLLLPLLNLFLTCSGIVIYLFFYCILSFTINGLCFLRGKTVSCECVIFGPLFLFLFSLFGWCGTNWIIWNIEQIEDERCSLRISGHSLLQIYLSPSFLPNQAVSTREILTENGKGANCYNSLEINEIVFLILHKILFVFNPSLYRIMSFPEWNNFVF